MPARKTKVDKATKADYVKKQGQTRSHACHGQMPGCRGQCPPAMWGCTRCWFKLPLQLRNKIWAAYQIGQEEGNAPVTREYLEVAREVQEWIRENYGERGT